MNFTRARAAGAAPGLIPRNDAVEPGVATLSRTARSRTFSSLANPDFRLLWMGLLFSQGAMQINIVGRTWLAYEVSGSGAVLGLVAMAQALPMGVLSLVGGAVADRLDKRKILVIVQASLAVLALITAILVHLNIVVVWHLVVVGLLQGASFSFSAPARQAVIPSLVSDEELTNAIAMNSTGLNFTRVIGPALAGVLMAINPALAFDAIAVLYVAAALMLLRLPRDLPALESRKSPVQDVLDGFRYVRRNVQVRALMILAFIPIMLGMPFQQFLPVFQKDVLHVSTFSLGIMYMAVGVGSLAGSLVVARMSDSRRLPALQILSGFVFGVSLVCFALSPNFVIALAALVLVGAASQGYMTMNSVLLMKNTDHQYFGRVMSIYLITFSAMPLAVLPMGFLIDAVGVSSTQAVAGALLAIFILVFTFSRQVVTRFGARSRVPELL
jgi:predicted MFS family arabinose efflux permease